MPFDGQLHWGSAPLLAPYAHHPEAPGAATAISDALRVAYMYSRTNSRLIGMQTYRQRHTHRNINYDRRISTTTWAGIAEFRAYIPSHATHIGSLAFYSAAHGQTAVVHHRVSVTDGSFTDTGDDISESIEPTSVQNNPLPFEQEPFTIFDKPFSRTGIYVAISNVQVPNTCTVTIQGYAVDNHVNAINYRPDFIVCWWEAID